MITVGKIVAAHGIKGQVKILSLSDNPHRFQPGQALTVAEQDTTVTIEATRRHKGNLLIVTLAGIADRDAAEALKGCTLSVPITELAPLPAGQFYRFQLEGLRVVTTDGEFLGVLDAILESGANDVYRVRGADGHYLLLPALKQVVLDVDLAAGAMTVRLLPGLLEACSYHED